MIRFFLLGLVLLLGGCGPRYVIKNQYIPPTASQAQSCLNHCTLLRQCCQNQCQKDYQYCLDEAYGKAKVVEAEELRSFERAYGHYDMDRMSYELEINNK